jgi:hypothetical protein
VVRIVAFQAIGSGSIPGGLILSGVAQWKRVGLITQRSKDRNLLPLFFTYSNIQILSHIILMGNISNLNHLIHFILGILSIKYHFIVPIFLLYQIIDGYKFKYILTTSGKQTDDIYLDLLLFALGGFSMRYI